MLLSLQLGHACRSGPASCWHAPNGCLVNKRSSRKQSVSYLWQIADSKNKANSVQDIWLSRAVQACNGVEFRIPTGDMGTRDIWLEAFYNKFLQVHGAEEDQVDLFACATLRFKSFSRRVWECELYAWSWCCQFLFLHIDTWMDRTSLAFTIRHLYTRWKRSCCCHCSLLIKSPWSSVSHALHSTSLLMWTTQLLSG